MLKPSPLFTFKHYAAIIKVLRATRPNLSQAYENFNNGTINNTTLMRIEAASLRYELIVQKMADMFAADNPRFKRELFCQECNREEAQ